MATNLELAGKVARCVELDAINLRYANVEAKYEPGTLPEEVDVDVQYRTSLTRRTREDSPTELVVLVEFKFDVKAKEVEEPQEVLSLSAGYLLSYVMTTEECLDEECFRHFSEVNGPYNAWPYWRELVQSVTGRVGLPGFVVPVFRPAVVELS